MITGFNCPYLFQSFKLGNYYLPGSVTAQIKQLKPGVLRYPGGTLANYSNTVGGGYGNGEGQATENFISRFAYLLNQLETTKVTYVANVYQALLTGDVNRWVDDTLNAIHKLPQIAYIELGNELNISGEYMQVADKPRLFESVSSYTAKVTAKAIQYLEVADKFIDAIRAENPEIRIGLPFGNPFTVRNKEWNRVLRTYRKHDLELFHLYLVTRQYVETENEIKKHFVGSLKPVAITEWSWQHGSDGSKNLADVKTLYFKYFFEDFPKICAKLGVEMICQHQLAGQNVYSKIRI